MKTANKYTLNRDFTLVSLMGHAITFVKGVPTNVPPMCEKEVIAIGGECVEGEGVDPIGPDVQPARELDQIERDDELTAAFKLLIEKNDSKDFTGAGTPNVKAVEKIIDFHTDRNEIDLLWRRLQEEGKL